MIQFWDKSSRGVLGWILLTLILILLLWMLTWGRPPMAKGQSTEEAATSSRTSSSPKSERIPSVSRSDRGGAGREEVVKIVGRFSPEVRTVIKLLQESELQRTSKAQDISNSRRTHFSFRIEPPSDDERAMLIAAVRAVEGMRNERGQDIVRWSDYLEKAYGLNDSYARQVAIMRENGESLLEYLSMVIISPDEAGDALGGSVIIGNEANAPQSWRYSHLMTFDLEEEAEPESNQE